MRLQHGADSAAWQEFHDRYGELIRSFAERRGLQPADCDDIVQDVLLSVSKAMPGFRYDPAKGYHVVSGKGTDSTAILDGFTITQGNADGSYPHFWGGGMYNDGSSPTVTNCTFMGNTGAFIAGAMRNDESSPTVVSCTFSRNVPGDLSGGGIYNANNSGATVAACILWANSDSNGMDESAQITDTTGSATVVTYSLIMGLDSFSGGPGNIDANPLFVRDPDDGGDGWGDDPNTPDVDEGTNDDFGDLRLGLGSPAIDAADNTAVPQDAGDLDGDGDTSEPIPFDLDGNPRFVEDPGVDDTGNPDGINPIVDMGAYEAQRCSDDSECDDGVFCNGAETCQTGLCQPGSDPCPGQQCDETTNECFTPSPPPSPPSPSPPPDEDGDGVPDSSDDCSGTAAGATIDADGCSCDQLDDDGDGVDNCEDDCAETPDTEEPGENGCSCSQLDCDDGDACTNDSCTDGTCVNALIDCGDGDLCTNDSCVEGECVNTDIDCGDGDACTGDSCIDGECVNTAIDCDDGDACTEDSCDDGECLNTAVECPVGQSCDPVSGECGPDDSDGDGVADAEDDCPGTPSGEAVESDGCRLFSVTLPGGAPAIRAREGDEVVITAPAAAAGFRFDYWEGDVPAGREHDNPLTLTLNSDKSLDPVYARIGAGDGRLCGAGGGCTPDAPVVGLILLGLLSLRIVGPGRGRCREPVEHGAK